MLTWKYLSFKVNCEVPNNIMIIIQSKTVKIVCFFVSSLLRVNGTRKKVHCYSSTLCSYKSQVLYLFVHLSNLKHLKLQNLLIAKTFDRTCNRKHKWMLSEQYDHITILVIKI